MKRLVAAAALTVIVAAISMPVFAQSPGASPAPETMASHAGPSGSHQMAEMCHHMMEHMAAMGGMGGGMMGRGMMGGPMAMMGPMGGGDPRQQADMMAMRGEMLKAMGDIMLKYSQRMQAPAR
jgi:hypothetical protein